MQPGLKGAPALAHTHCPPWLHPGGIYWRSVHDLAGLVADESVSSVILDMNGSMGYLKQLLQLCPDLGVKVRVSAAAPAPRLQCTAQHRGPSHAHRVALFCLPAALASEARAPWLSLVRAAAALAAGVGPAHHHHGRHPRGVGDLNAARAWKVSGRRSSSPPGLLPRDGLGFC